MATEGPIMEEEGRGDIGDVFDEDDDLELLPDSTTLGDSIIPEHQIVGIPLTNPPKLAFEVPKGLQYRAETQAPASRLAHRLLSRLTSSTELVGFQLSHLTCCSCCCLWYFVLYFSASILIISGQVC